MFQSTMERISALEHERQELLNSSDDWSFADASRIDRIRSIRAELDRLWDTERQQRATKRNQSSNQARQQRHT